MSPFAAGIGIASAAVSFVIGLYYNTMVAWTLLYLWGSASTVLTGDSDQLARAKKPPFSVCPEAKQQLLRAKEPASERAEALAGLSFSASNVSIETECQVSRCWPPSGANI